MENWKFRTYPRCLNVIFKIFHDHIRDRHILEHSFKFGRKLAAAFRLKYSIEHEIKVN